MTKQAPPEDEATLGPPADPESVARTICLRLLTQRARTRAELAGALERKGVPAESATRVLDRFTEVGLIDDDALAESYALAQHRERGLAARAVAMKLRGRGLAEETVRDAVGLIDGDSERAAAEALVARRRRSMAGLAPPAQSRRLVGLLARRGYSPALAHEVVSSALRDCLADDDG
jgi:regulatory protein